MSARQDLREWVGDLLLAEELSNEDIAKIKGVGHKTAKAVHKDNYDQAKAEKTINSIIKQGVSQGKGADDISNIVQNAFRQE